MPDPEQYLQVTIFARSNIRPVPPQGPHAPRLVSILPVPEQAIQTSPFFLFEIGISTVDRLRFSGKTFPLHFGQVS
jgi:hypothetical protein